VHKKLRVRWTGITANCARMAVDGVAMRESHAFVILSDRTELLFQFAFFRCIGGPRKFQAVAIGIGQRDNPQTVPHKRALPSLNSTRFELAIKSECIFTLETDGDSSPERFL